MPDEPQSPEESDGVDEVPSNLQYMLDNIPFFMPEGVDEITMEVITRGAQGNCMTCESPLGSNTHLVINAQGIALAFCGGACMTDMQVSGWLEEVYDDLKDKVKFRGGRGDQVG